MSIHFQHLSEQLVKIFNTNVYSRSSSLHLLSICFKLFWFLHKPPVRWSFCKAQTQSILTASGGQRDWHSSLPDFKLWELCIDLSCKNSVLQWSIGSAGWTAHLLIFLDNNICCSLFAVTDGSMLSNFDALPQLLLIRTEWGRYYSNHHFTYGATEAQKG